MEITSFNPSPLEIAFGEAISKAKSAIEKELPEELTIIGCNEKLHQDNPQLRFKIQDSTTEKEHELVITLIHKPENVNAS